MQYTTATNDIFVLWIMIRVVAVVVIVAVVVTGDGGAVIVVVVVAIVAVRWGLGCYWPTHGMVRQESRRSRIVAS